MKNGPMFNFQLGPILTLKPPNLGPILTLQHIHRYKYIYIYIYIYVSFLLSLSLQYSLSESIFPAILADLG